MHIKVNRQNFLSAMRVVEKAIKENKIKPILSCVYIKVKENKLNFCGTNLENTIKTFIDIEEVIEAGEIAFHYHIIDEYLKEIKDEIITLRVEGGNNLFIETEDSTTEFSVFSSEDYPNSFDEIVLNENNLKFEMPSEELIDAFEKIIFAADTQDNIAMNCIRIESILKHLHFVATNTYRLAFLKKPTTTNIENFSVSVPKDAAKEAGTDTAKAAADTAQAAADTAKAAANDAQATAGHAAEQAEAVAENAEAAAKEAKDAAVDAADATKGAAQATADAAKDAAQATADAAKGAAQATADAAKEAK